MYFDVFWIRLICSCYLHHVLSLLVTYFYVGILFHVVHVLTSLLLCVLNDETC